MREWDNSKCVCVHWDAVECSAIRDRRTFGVDLDEDTTRHDWGMRRRCECCCHDIEPDEDDL